MVDKVSSANIINMLNEFFGVMVEIIDQHGGHVNKFMGDSILTFLKIREAFRIVFLMFCIVL